MVLIFMNTVRRFLLRIRRIWVKLSKVFILLLTRYIDVQTAIAVAQLALKHRENKNLRQRIIVFVASPLDGPGADEQSMVKLAKKLKKNNVAVDIISFGDGIEEADADGKTVLKLFVDNVTSSDNLFVFFIFLLFQNFVHQLDFFL